MAVAAPTVIEAPTRTGAPYGLFSTFSFRENGDGRWQAGVVWEALACGPASGIGDPSCDPETPTIGLPKGDAEPAGNGEASPFTVYFKEKCDPVGRVAVAQDRANTSLMLKEQMRVEQALWTGDLGNVPNLQTVESTVGDSSPAAVLAAITLGLRRDYGGLGTIHVGLVGAAVLEDADLLKRDGERVRTIYGDAVSIGAGYLEVEGGDLLGPADAGNVWIIASPPVFGYRSEVFTSSERTGDLLDRGNNDFYGVAERTYLLGFDPCGVIAAQMSTGGSGGGGSAEVLAAIDAQTATLQGDITDATAPLATSADVTAASTAIQANDDGNTGTITGAITTSQGVITANDDSNTADILAAINPA